MLGVAIIRVRIERAVPLRQLTPIQKIHPAIDRNLSRPFRYQSFFLRARLHILTILFQAIHEGSKQIVKINSDDNRVYRIIAANLIERFLERL